MPFRISQEHRADAPATFRLAGRLTGDAIDVLMVASVNVAAGVIMDLSEVSYADDAGVKALETLRGRGAVLQGSRPYLALLLQLEDRSGSEG
jgi:anti-anti-sigma regulatory factor